MIKFYNTLTRKKDNFSAAKNKTVGIYSCGPTVYNYAHIGNLRTYIFADLLVKTLKFNGFKIKWVMNITDVGHLTSDADIGEDKLEKGALREKKTVWEIADFYTKAFKNDLVSLNVAKPDIWTKATDNISEQIQIIKMLEKKGFTYKTSDGIYFDTSRFSDYGKLAQLDVKGLKAGARIEKSEEKRNITDFALWKFSPKDKKRQMEWSSPWGKGFPGWHLECSAMSMRFLSPGVFDENHNFHPEKFKTIDIHTGAIDHIPIHHTNEIAQSEAATGIPFVKLWLHGEFLDLKSGIKMAKSAENFITLQKLIDKKIQPLVFRYLCLMTHYQKKLNFSWEALKNAQDGLSNLWFKVGGLKTGKGKILKNYLEKFTKAINNNLDLPQAMSIAWDVIKSDEKDEDKRITLNKFDEVLGLNFDVKPFKETIDEYLIKKKEEYISARKVKNYQLSDQLRRKLNEELAKFNLQISDTKDGAEFVKK